MMHALSNFETVQNCFVMCVFMPLIICTSVCVYRLIDKS